MSILGIKYWLQDKFSYVERNMTFIYGKSACGGEASVYQANEIDVLYDKKKKLYILGVETAFIFKEEEDECLYLEELLEDFTEFMLKNNISTKYEYPFFCSCPSLGFSAKTIEELYFNFSVFVRGYCSYYREEE